MKVEVIKCLSHLVELNFGEISVCITTADAENLIAQLRAVVPVPAGVEEAEIRKINISPSEVRYVIDAIHSYAGIFRTEDDAKKGLAIFKAGMLAERERMMSGALRGAVAMCGVSAWVELPLNELTDYLRSNFKDGDDVGVIIIKKEDEK